jgi:hypothetical protein
LVDGEEDLEEVEVVVVVDTEAPLLLPHLIQKIRMRSHLPLKLPEDFSLDFGLE